MSREDSSRTARSSLSFLIRPNGADVAHEAAMKPFAVLVVDDNEAMLAVVARFLRREGFEVMTTSTTIGVSAVIRSFRPDTIVLDLEMPAINGDRVAKLIRSNFGPMVPIILYSAADVSTLTDMARESANTIFVSKDEGVHGLHGAICLALRIPVGKRTQNASS
jgi:two-component system OmpR family response regulator